MSFAFLTAVLRTAFFTEVAFFFTLFFTDFFIIHTKRKGSYPSVIIFKTIVVIFIKIAERYLEQAIAFTKPFEAMLGTGRHPELVTNISHMSFIVQRHFHRTFNDNP